MFAQKVCRSVVLSLKGNLKVDYMAEQLDGIASDCTDEPNQVECLCVNTLPLGEEEYFKTSQLFP